jgi:hypothetical protein
MEKIPHSELRIPHFLSGYSQPGPFDLGFNFFQG